MTSLMNGPKTQNSCISVDQAWKKSPTQRVTKKFRWGEGGGHTEQICGLNYAHKNLCGQQFCRGSHLFVTLYGGKTSVGS